MQTDEPEEPWSFPRYARTCEACSDYCRDPESEMFPVREKILVRIEYITESPQKAFRG